ncbi:MAG TPA: hypothetical protein VK327_06850 [Candidatus Paceibacterota bacterium]|nr:hypothetical protein [Candidatus Paceibacterota bacterium]
MRAAQLDFPLSVAVCAWCEPHPPAGGIGALSHGICPRHLKLVKLEYQGLLPKRRRRSRSRDDSAQMQFST